MRYFSLSRLDYFLRSCSIYNKKSSIPVGDLDRPLAKIKMKTTQNLPFNIVVSRDGATTSRLMATRVRAYGRHSHPIQNSEHFQKTLKTDSALLLSAECKMSGECLGSIRIESNIKGRFYFEDEITTPDLEGRVASVCASRLSVTKGQTGRLVKEMLCKSLYLYSHAMQCKYVYAFVDKPRFRLYTSLGFTPAIAENPTLTLECHDHLPLQLVRSEVNAFELTLTTLNPNLKELYFATYHPDIKIFSSVGSLADVRRKNDLATFHGPPESRLLPTPTV
jgi:hypothetical protein